MKILATILIVLMPIVYIQAQVDDDFNGEKEYNQLWQRKRIIDSTNITLEWREIRDNLWINKFDNLGFKASRKIAVMMEVQDYKLHFDLEDNRSLKDVIDISTFKRIAGDDSAAMYQDKNNIYHFSEHLAEYGFVILHHANYNSFKPLNDWYAIDKKYVYYIPLLTIENADPKTFKAINCYAKDKNHYYYNGFVLTEERMSDPEVKEILKKLDKL